MRSRRRPYFLILYFFSLVGPSFFVFIYLFFYYYYYYYYYSVCNVRVCRRRAAVVFNTKRAMYVCARMHTCMYVCVCGVCVCVCVCASLPTHVYIKRQSLIFSRRTELTVKCTSQTPNVYHPAALARGRSPHERPCPSRRRGRRALPLHRTAI